LVVPSVRMGEFLKEYESKTSPLSSGHFLETRKPRLVLSCLIVSYLHGELLMDDNGFLIAIYIVYGIRVASIY